MGFTTSGRLEVRITGSDVGKRVSIRSLTAGGERSERFTDTVGILTSWTAGTLTVTRRDGRHVEIDETALVAGKVVPPAPARRRGAPSASVRELTTVAARGWPAVETASLGGWTLRASAGFTSRANSVLPLGDPSLPLPEALAHVERWYGERGLAPLVQVAPEENAVLARELEQRGWTALRHALMRTGALAPLADRAPDDRVRLHRAPDAAWVSLYHRAADALPEEGLRVLAGGPSVWFATVPGPDSEAPPAAIGRCVVDGRWAGFAALEVAPAHRRQGLATTVMAELARAALREGASAAYLQVETGNSGALALYDGLGFADHHAYHYLRAPGA
ncbi:GNAT family N-acetyltransferase [Streptomyces cacaoi]|uniref:GNAT family N-acetyltransferase n=1 Tax=Streptomyces cacaoi TaxID=1898 RepID=UPI00261B85F6|nr:GNAT family N-acetyltransferase [Streptomyces cacaoi]